MIDGASQLLAKFERPDHEIQVAWTHFRDKTFLSIRRFYVDPDDGKLRATRKGVTFQAADLEKLAETIRKAAEIAVAESELEETDPRMRDK